MSTADHVATARLAGREVELATIHTFQESVTADPAGLAALVLAGEPGIGKTALWEVAVGTATATELSTSAAQAESSWSFTGLTDLLDAVADELIPQLPAPLGRRWRSRCCAGRPATPNQGSARQQQPRGGATLVVSVRTVEGHLAAIYRKLEVTGRTALTAKLAAS